MNWFSRMIGWNTQSVTAPAVDPPRGAALAALAIKSNTTQYPFRSTKPDIELLKGTVAACLNARASERGVIKFVVREGDQETAIAKKIQRMLNKPNAVQSRVDIMETASHFHDATGNAIFYFVRDKDDEPVEMWVLPSFYVIALFENTDDPIPTAYKWADGRVITETKNLCFVRMNSVKTAPYTGRGFLGDQIDSAILYDLVVQSQKNWFYNGGAPNVALVMKEGIPFTKEQIELMQKSWNEKYNPATGVSNIAVLPDGVTPKDFGPQELNFATSKEELRDSIREALQTPKIILGDTDNVNHNNGQTALAMFERLVVIRWAEKVANAFECYFKQWGERITITIDPKVSAGFTQLPTANGIVDLPNQFQFSSPQDPNG